MTLLGDVVASREASDRRVLHAGLTAVLARVDDAAPSLSGLRTTVGDEFQGTYATLGEALDASLRIRVALLPEIDVRVGLGRGEVLDLDADRGIQDGPGWWAARSAIEEVEESARRAALRSLRAAYHLAKEAGEEGGPIADAVNAALVCQCQLLGSLSERALRLLAGLIDGQTTQVELAEREGISASAVSQQVRSSGIGAILHAHELMRRLP